MIFWSFDLLILLNLLIGGVCKVVRFCRETPQTIYQAKELGSLITNIENFLKNFQNFGNLWGSEISDISKSGSFLHAHKNPTIYISFKSPCYTDFKRVNKIKNVWKFENLAGVQNFAFQEKSLKGSFFSART